MNYFDGGHWLWSRSPLTLPASVLWFPFCSVAWSNCTSVAFSDSWSMWPGLLSWERAVFCRNLRYGLNHSGYHKQIWSLLQAKTQFWNRLRPNVDHRQVSSVVTDYTHSPHRMSPNHSYTVNPDTNHTLSHDPSSRPSSNVRCSLSPEPTQTNLIQTQSDT